MKPGEYERLYERENYLWGKGTSGLATKTLEYAPSTSGNTTLIDIGAGKCRDSVFFAERGFEVCAMDASPAGLRKGRQLANERDVTINTIEADANDFEFPKSFDVVHSSGAVQYIHPENRKRQFGRFKRDTVTDGVHSIFAIIDHPETSPARIGPKTDGSTTGRSFRSITPTGKYYTPERSFSITAGRANRTCTRRVSS